MADLTQQVVEMTLGSVNIALVVVLICIGAVLKHAIKSLDNNDIPIIIICLGIVLVLLLNLPFNPQEMLLTYLVQGIGSGYCAIIIHSKSKEIYKDFIAKGNTLLSEDKEDE